jgi:hypothetical protein
LLVDNHGAGQLLKWALLRRGRRSAGRGQFLPFQADNANGKREKELEIISEGEATPDLLGNQLDDIHQDDGSLTRRSCVQYLSDTTSGNPAKIVKISIPKIPLS